MTAPLERRLETAVSAARRAGDLLLRHAERGVTVEHKGRIDLVSEADRAAEASIRADLSEAFPDELVVGEEGAFVAETETTGRSRWYVDPLDGTTNYLRGSGRWAVAIGWASPADTIEVGVVFRPRSGELFRARRGGGAHLDVIGPEGPVRSSELRVSEPGSLEEAVIASGFPYELHDGPNNLREWAAVTLQARSVRCLGAAAVDICDVARGRLDGFWERRLGRWDTAAGMVIAAEAGAMVTDLDGAPLLAPATDIVVAGWRIHRELLAALQGGPGDP